MGAKRDEETCGCYSFLSMTRCQSTSTETKEMDSYMCICGQCFHGNHVVNKIMICNTFLLILSSLSFATKARLSRATSGRPPGWYPIGDQHMRYRRRHGSSTRSSMPSS